MGQLTVDLKGVSVMIGMPCGHEIPIQTARSLIATMLRLEKMGIPCDLGNVAGSPVVHSARDEVADLFLGSGANRLFWVDSDIAWNPDDFVRLMALSTLVPVVGAAYSAKMDPPGFMIQWDEKQGLKPDEHGLIEVQGMGLGFTVMLREVVEKVAATKPRVRDEVSGKTMVELFRNVSHGGVRRTEDVAFFADIREAGFKVLLDPQVQLGHVGRKVYTASIIDVINR